MRVHRTLLLLLALGIASNATAQTSGIHSEYFRDNNLTRVETNGLYVYDTPDQFIQLMLRGWYKGEKPTALPTRLAVAVFSFSKSPLYQRDKDRTLTIVADGTTLPIGNLINQALEPETVQLPPIAKLAATANPRKLTIELLQLNLKPEQVLRLATATKIEFQIGRTSLVFNDRQIEIAHNFAKQFRLQ